MYGKFHEGKWINNKKKENVEWHKQGRSVERK